VRAYIQLGKLGDVVSILPCLHADFQETGEKANLVISRRYAHILEGLDYVDPVIWTGDWHDVSGALREAKARFGVVAIPQMHAKDYVPRREFPSFQLDQWNRCGRLHQWGNLSLQYPKTEASIDSRFILVGDQSESSPFPQIEDLNLLLTKEFPSHRIVRLSSQVLPYRDLLALYDAADLIVTIDTFHAHFSMASKTPVIVLATDKPSRWHGTAYHPRMAAHIRYGDYEIKKSQLIHIAKQCVYKSVTPVMRREPSVNGYGYNMSMMAVGNNLWKTYRYHPAKSWRTELVLMREGHEFPIKVPAQYAKHSIEDGRLFMFRGRPHISLTVARSRLPGMNFDPCIQAYGELLPDGAIMHWQEPKIGKNDWTGQEKNWTFWDYNGTLHITYAHAPAHVVYALESGRVKHEYRTPVPTCDFGDPRGGTQRVEYKGQWLKFFHANQINLKSDAKQNYHVGAMLIEPSPPFRITKISSHPVVSGNELWSPAPHWKPKCKLVYGVIDNAPGWDISLGSNDCECQIAHIWEENLAL
jgi:hypothetical protein